MMDRTQEKIDILFGDRRGAPDEAAARLKHLRAILNTVPAEPDAVTLAAAPTADQYNLILEDVRKLYAGLNALRTLLR